MIYSISDYLIDRDYIDLLDISCIMLKLNKFMIISRVSSSMSASFYSDIYTIGLPVGLSSSEIRGLLLILVPIAMNMPAWH